MESDREKRSDSRAWGVLSQLFPIKCASCIIPAILLAASFSACNGSTPGWKEGALNKTLWIFRYYEYSTEYLQLSKDAREPLAEEVRSHKFPVEYPKKQDVVGIPCYAARLAMKIKQIICPKSGLISHFAIQY